MRSHHTRWFRAALFCLILSQGCTTLRERPDPLARPEVLRPDADAERRAQALMLSYAAETAQDDGAAITNVLQALALDPDSEDLRLQAALKLMEAGDTRCVDVLRDGLRIHPDSSEIRLWLALAYRHTAREEDALVVYRELIAREPTEPAAYTEAMDLLIGFGRFDEMIEIARAGVGKVPEPVELLGPATASLMREVSALEDGSGIPEPIQQAARTLASLAADEQKRRPEEPAAPLLRADLLVMSGDPDKAVDVLHELERERPGDSVVGMKLMGLLSGLGDPVQALAVVDRLIRQEPGDGRFHYLRSEFLRRTGQDDDAESALRRSIEARTPAPEGFIRLSLIDFQAGRTNEALQWLEKGAARLPSDTRLHELKGNLLLSIGLPAPAVQSLERAIRVRKTDGDDAEIPPSLRLSYLVALQQSGDREKAAGQLQEAIDDDPAFLPAFAQVISALGDPAQALAAADVIDDVREADPDDPNPAIYQGLLYSAAESYTNAYAALQEARDLARALGDEDELLDSAFFFWLGSTAERLGRYEEAATHFLHCLKRDDENAEAMNYLAYMWAEQGVQLDEALRWSRRSLELDPENPAYLDTLGWIYFKKGQLDAALKEILRAANLIPDDPTIVEHLGDLMNAKGKPDRALEYWKRSFVLDPDNPRVRELLEERGTDLTPLQKEALELRELKSREESMRSVDDVMDDPDASFETIP